MSKRNIHRVIQINLTLFASLISSHLADAILGFHFFTTRCFSGKVKVRPLNLLSQFHGLTDGFARLATSKQKSCKADQSHIFAPCIVKHLATELIKSDVTKKGKVLRARKVPCQIQKVWCHSNAAIQTGSPTSYGKNQLPNYGSKEKK